MTQPLGDAPTLVPASPGQDATLPPKAAPTTDLQATQMTRVADRVELAATVVNTPPATFGANGPTAPTMGQSTVDAATIIQGGTHTEGTRAGTVSGTAAGTFGGTGMGGTLSRTGTRLSRTRINGGLQQTEQQLDEKLQMSRGSVLADMTTFLGQQREGGGVPKGLQKLIEEQGTEGRYHINRPLAAGGMGAVLDIADNDFRRQAAMKVIHGRFANDPQALERFLAEAQVTAQLEHPNIVPIHDLGVMADGTLYFTMKLIEGFSLGDVVKFRQMHQGLLTEEDYVKDKLRKDNQKPAADRKGEAKIRAEYTAEKAKGAELEARFTIEETLLAFLKVLDGVGFAHSRGVIHRDIKPDNIMLGGHGEVLVVDWGIAKVLGTADKTSELVRNIEKTVVSIRDADSMSATMAGSAMGTIFYMPPEQASGDLERIDARSDVYALGATLYELLSLKRCLKASTIPEMIANITTGEWIPFATAMPGVDPDLAAIIHRSMALTPDNRYATCDAFAEDIRRFLGGQAVAARKRGVGELLAKWIAQNKTKLFTGAAGVVLVVGAAVGTVEYLKAQRLAQAQALVVEAKAKYEAAAAAKDLDGLTQARVTVETAKSLDPANPSIPDLREAIGKATEAVQSALAAEQAKAANLAKAKSLVDEAAALETAGKLPEADSKLVSALELDPTNSGYRQIRDKLSDKLRDQRRRVAEAEAQRIRAEGDALFAQAKALALTDAQLPGLLSQAEAKFALAEKDVAVPGTQDQVKAVALLRDQAAKAAKAQADQAKAATLLEQAQAAFTAGAPAGKFDDARTLAAQARGFDPGNDAAVQLIARIQSEAEQYAAKAKAAAAEKQCRALVAEARTLLAAGDLDGAEARCAQALGQVKGDDEAIVVKAQVAAAKEVKLRELRRQTAVAKSDEHLAQAKAANAKMLAATATWQQAQTTADDLGRRLAQEPLDRKAPLWTALATAETARKDVALQWAATETAAQNGLAFLGDFPEEKARIAALRQILADLYHLRLVEARVSRNLTEVGAYTNLLRRFDDGAYAQELADRGRLTITGGTGLTLRRIEEGSDTRLVPVGDAQPVESGKPLDLEAGTYQVSGGGISLAIVVTSRKPVAVTWPGALPTIPGHSLKYVPSDGVRPAFLLGETEVTQAQYLEFLRAPEQFKRIAAAYKDMIGQILAGESKTIALPFLPSADDRRSFKFHKVKEAAGKEGQLGEINLTGRIERQPISAVDKATAEAFCAWLAKSSGLKVRLPSSAERLWAATGGDDRRVYPWGRRFSGQFATSALNGQPSTVPAVGSTPADVGPFGHVDLAGSVREWLNDGRTPDNPLAAGIHGALIAGGSYTDDSQIWFRSEYNESADPAVALEQIGFRILVELP